MNQEVLLQNIDKVHTTEMGIDRIKKNLKLDTNNVVEFCKSKVLDNNCNIYKQGKNWYCEIDNIKITINSYSYTIITAHIIKFCDFVQSIIVYSCIAICKSFATSYYNINIFYCILNTFNSHLNHQYNSTI